MKTIPSWLAFFSLFWGSTKTLSSAYQQSAKRPSNLVVNRPAVTETRFFGSTGDDYDEDTETFRRIAKTYLTSKFKNCRGDDCRTVCTREEIKSLLKTVLPPVTNLEMEQEINQVYAKIGNSQAVEADQFLEAVLDNSYWEEAGPLVVKELIFLDCIRDYYTEKRVILDDDDYNELKEMLTWEGSSVATLKGKEAKFISSVASFRRGQSNLSDTDYEKLKSELQSENSWVVKRMQDPLEKLGMKTFLGYLHRSLN